MARIMRKSVTAAALALVWAGAVLAATPPQKCQSSKNKAVAKYAACRQNAEAKLAGKAGTCSTTTSTVCYHNAGCPYGETCNKDLTKYYEAFTKCATKYQNAWQKAEQKAVDAGSACQTTSDEAAVQGVTDDFTDNVAQHLAGAPLEDCPADLATCQAELATCYGAAYPPAQPPRTGDTTSYGSGSDGDLRKGVSRAYTDNGDGTITDIKTGLMWEKKDLSGGIHDVFNHDYTWGMTSSPYTMNGTMVTEFLATLNTAPCFAGHCDWRIPNRFELETLLDLGRTGPAIDPAFNASCAGGCTVDGNGGPMCSCTVSSYYWSSTTLQNAPDLAWVVYFSYGDMEFDGKSSENFVRAVRGGL